MARNPLRRLAAATIAAALIAISLASYGQTPEPATRALRGVVADSSGATIPGAAVTLERNGQIVARTTTDARGAFAFNGIAAGDYRIRVEMSGFIAATRDVRVGADTSPLRIALARDGSRPAQAAEAPRDLQREPPEPPASAAVRGQGRGLPTSNAPPAAAAPPMSGVGQRAVMDAIYPPAPPPRSGETYAHFDPNTFQRTIDRPLSTFGADVDTASYANVRRFLSNGQLPPSDAIRIEEFVNYFRFDYPIPRGAHPIGLTAEIADCPWATSHKLVLIGARARSQDREIAGRNIVLLVDVSGSMQPADRLPMLRSAFGMFVDTLRPNDRLAIVTYAGSSGVALPSTPVRQRDVIQRAIANLSAGGSTNGAQGIVTAYQLARQHFVAGGVNRVILATDGDFNVGLTSRGDLLRLIERERESGVFLSVLGVGTDNLRDATMEMLADRGNGHYAYLDSLGEARRVLVADVDSTLETVAKDVKFQVEFNPAVVRAWKLLGYENRALAARDFNDDRKDAGDVGAGHTVTVLYEVIPAGAKSDDDEDRPSIDPLRYQPSSPSAERVAAASSAAASSSTEWLTVKVRYKQPDGDTSHLLSQPVRPGGRVRFLPFAAAVAEFGLLLQDHAGRDDERWAALERRLRAIEVPASTSDRDGFRELVSMARGLSRLR